VPSLAHAAAVSQPAFSTISSSSVVRKVSSIVRECDSPEPPAGSRHSFNDFCMKHAGMRTPEHDKQGMDIQLVENLGHLWEFSQMGRSDPLRALLFVYPDSPRISYF